MLGTAYRIRTGDLRLERAVSWASRRMRQGLDGWRPTVAEDTRGAANPRNRGGRRRPTGGWSRGTRGASRRPGGSSARRARARSASGPRTARTARRATPPAARPRAPGRRRRGPPPITSRGTSGSADRSTGTPWRTWRFDRARLERLLAQQVLDPQDVGEREVAVLALELLGQRLPAERGAPVGVGDVAHDVGPDRVADLLRELGRDEHVAPRPAPARRP